MKKFLVIVPASEAHSRPAIISEHDDHIAAEVAAQKVGDKGYQEVYVFGLNGICKTTTKHEWSKD